MSKAEIIYNGFTIANIPEGQTGKLACKGKKMKDDVTISYKRTGISKLAQIVDKTITEVTADDLKGARAIGHSAFRLCSELKSVTIPNGVASIGMNAFDGCRVLISVKIPNGFASIAQWAFQNCVKLEVVDFSQVTAIPTIAHDQSFYSVPNTCKIVVPDALYDSWITATNWSAITLTFVKASEYTGG